MTQSIINFHTFLGTLNVPVEDIKRYLVYRTGNPPATSPQPAATPPTIPPAAEVMHSFGKTSYAINFDNKIHLYNVIYIRTYYSDIMFMPLKDLFS